MRLILAAPLAFLTGAVLAVGLVGRSGEIPGVPGVSDAFDIIATGSTMAEPNPIRRVPQPVKVIVAQSPAAPADAPTDLTEPQAPTPQPTPIRPTTTPGP
ncbi:MAG TPA: hypothetical protein VFK86_10130, partial [Bauldia sp.]|nr:hypothetical protein [Bauldia sp.]